MMNETRNNPADRGDRAGVSVRRRGTDIKRRIEQLLSRRPMVYRRSRPLTDTTEIRWNRVYEVYECVKCHSIMYYDFKFEVCPYCRRPIRKTGERRF